MHVGEAITDDDGQPFGLAVHVVARICDTASPGGTHLSRPVAEVAGPLQLFDLRMIDVYDLKGVGQPMVLYVAGARADAATG